MSRTTRIFALLVPFALTTALVGGIQPAVAAPGGCTPSAPDAQIKGGNASLVWVGADVYTPVTQAYQRQVRPGNRDQFNIKIENDSDCPDIFTVMGQFYASKYIANYYSLDAFGVPDANITAAVIAGTYQTDTVLSGESEFIRAYIYVRPGVRSGSAMTDVIGIGSSDLNDPVSDFGAAEVRDFVTARVVVNRRAGDFNSSLPTL